MNLRTLFLATSNDDIYSAIHGIHCVKYDDNGDCMIRIEATDGNVCVCLSMNIDVFLKNCLESFNLSPDTDLSDDTNLTDFTIFEIKKSKGITYYEIKINAYPDILKALPSPLDLIPTNVQDTLAKIPVLTFETAARVYKILSKLGYDNQYVFTLYNKKFAVLVLPETEEGIFGFVLIAGTSKLTNMTITGHCITYTKTYNSFLPKDKQLNAPDFS